MRASMQGHALLDKNRKETSHQTCETGPHPWWQAMLWIGSVKESGEERKGKWELMERYGQFARCQLPNKPSQEVDTKGKLDTSLGRASISEIWRSSKNKARWVVNIGHSEFSLQKTAASRRTTDAKGACYSRPSCIHMLSHSNRTQSEVSCAEVEDGSSLKASGKRCGGDPVKVILQSHLPDTGPYSRLEIDSL